MVKKQSGNDEDNIKKMIRCLIKLKKGNDLETIRKKLGMSKSDFLKFACG